MSKHIFPLTREQMSCLAFWTVTVLLIITVTDISDWYINDDWTKELIFVVVFVFAFIFFLVSIILILDISNTYLKKNWKWKDG